MVPRVALVVQHSDGSELGERKQKLRASYCRAVERSARQESGKWVGDVLGEEIDRLLVSSRRRAQIAVGQCVPAECCRAEASVRSMPTEC